MLRVVFQLLLWLSVSLKKSSVFSSQFLPSSSKSVDKMKVAIVVTIAGKLKLSEYFDWTCTSVGDSSEMFDLLVFHEGNTEIMKREREHRCASNVKFFDLGDFGLSQLIVDQIIDNDKSLDKLNDKRLSAERLTETLSEVIANIPRYLVEIKPMTGEMFKEWLKPYSHWTYSDPDILWGDLKGWVSVDDLQRYDIVSFGKNMDAGRLFLRGQFSMHKNIDKVNTIWRELSYLTFGSFLKRLSGALREIKQKKLKSEEIFGRFFFSAEGLYSVRVLEKDRDSEISIKICGRSFDDFSQLPALRMGGKLFRCPTYNITECIEERAKTSEVQASIYDLPGPKYIPAKAYFHEDICRMQWLPVATRQCIASESFSKDSLKMHSSSKESQEMNLRLLRVGEAVFEKGKWSINDERASRRGGNAHVAAYFHFRHWDDVVARGVFTQLPIPDNNNFLNADCMVLRIRVDNTLAYETCASAIEFDRIEWRGIEQFQAATRKDAVEKMLDKIRRTKEGGKKRNSRGNKHNLRAMNKD